LSSRNTVDTADLAHVSEAFNETRIGDPTHAARVVGTFATLRIGNFFNAVQVADVNGKKVVLCLDSDLTGVNAPANTGDNVIYIANATTVPTADAVGGGILYVEGGALKYRGSGGTVTILGAA